MESKGAVVRNKRESEVQALREELAASRVASHLQRDAEASTRSDTAATAAETRADPAWEHVKQLIEELTVEIGDATRPRPLLIGAAAAFALGLLCGRSLARHEN